MEGPVNRSVNGRIELNRGLFTVSTKPFHGGQWSGPRTMNKQEMKELETALKRFNAAATSLSPTQVLVLASAQGALKTALHPIPAPTAHELKQVLTYSEGKHLAWKTTKPAVVIRGNVVKQLDVRLPAGVGGAKVTAYLLKNGQVVFEKSVHDANQRYLGPMASRVPQT